MTIAADACPPPLPQCSPARSRQLRVPLRPGGAEELYFGLRTIMAGGGWAAGPPADLGLWPGLWRAHTCLGRRRRRRRWGAAVEGGGGAVASGCGAAGGAGGGGNSGVRVRVTQVVPPDVQPVAVQITDGAERAVRWRYRRAAWHERCSRSTDRWCGGGAVQRQSEGVSLCTTVGNGKQ